MVAPSLTCSSTLLRRWIAPVRKAPAGTSTRPPPAQWHPAIALANASVLSVSPSPTAPGRAHAGQDPRHLGPRAALAVSACRRERRGTRGERTGNGQRTGGEEGSPAVHGHVCPRPGRARRGTSREDLHLPIGVSSKTSDVSAGCTLFPRGTRASDRGAGHPVLGHRVLAAYLHARVVQVAPTPHQQV